MILKNHNFIFLNNQWSLPAQAIVDGKKEYLNYEENPELRDFFENNGKNKLPVLSFKHSITKYKIHVEVFELTAKETQLSRKTQTMWISETQSEDYLISSLFKKLFLKRSLNLF